MVVLKMNGETRLFCSQVDDVKSEVEDLSTRLEARDKERKEQVCGRGHSFTKAGSYIRTRITQKKRKGDGSPVPQVR